MIILFQILHSLISSADKLPITKQGYPLRVHTKHFFFAEFIISKERECSDLHATLNQLKPGYIFNITNCVRYFINKLILAIDFNSGIGLQSQLHMSSGSKSQPVQLPTIFPLPIVSIRKLIKPNNKLNCTSTSVYISCRCPFIKLYARFY